MCPTHVGPDLASSLLASITTLFIRPSSDGTYYVNTHGGRACVRAGNICCPLSNSNILCPIHFKLSTNVKDHNVSAKFDYQRNRFSNLGVMALYFFPTSRNIISSEMEIESGSIYMYYHPKTNGNLEWFNIHVLSSKNGWKLRMVQHNMKIIAIFSKLPTIRVHMCDGRILRQT